MKNNYQKIMDEVSLSEDQKEQMLANIMRADLTPVRRRRSWKPVYAFLAMGACALVILPRIMPMGMSGGAAPMLAESAAVAEDKMISDDAAVQNTARGAMAAEPADSLPAEEESLADAGDPLIEALPAGVDVARRGNTLLVMNFTGAPVTVTLPRGTDARTGEAVGGETALEVNGIRVING